VRLPGGDAVVRRPARSALAHLRAAGIDWDPALAPVAACGRAELDVVDNQLTRDVGCVATSSMGRLFDAVASLVGACHTATYEAQAPLRLEALAADVCPGHERAAADRYRFALDGDELDPRPVLAALVEDIRGGVAPSLVSAAFHHAVAEAVGLVARSVRDRTGVGTVGLTGGVFQNAVLLSATRCRLVADGFRVLVHTLVPPNDGAIALGQAAVVAARHGAPCRTTPRRQEI
jgi:hydrogenase maturation protein HypF